MCYLSTPIFFLEGQWLEFWEGLIVRVDVNKLFSFGHVE